MRDGCFRNSAEISRKSEKYHFEFVDFIYFIFFFGPEFVPH